MSQFNIILGFQASLISACFNQPVYYIRQSRLDYTFRGLFSNTETAEDTTE